MTTTLARQDSLLYTHKLPTGLQMLGQYIPGVQSVAVVYYVDTGTRDEIEREMGLSHFLEHMAFKRTEHLTGSEIDHTFEQIGAEHNAGTWKEMTFYWVRVLGENLPRAIEVVTELTHPVLDHDDFETERKVILEEIARYQDMPSYVMSDRLFRDYFGNHPLAWDTLGTPETIRNMKVEQMRAYWEQRYGSSNILFAIAGNFDWEQVKSQVGNLTEGWQAGRSGRVSQPFSFKPSFGVYQHEKFVQEQIGIAFPSVSNKDPRYFTAAVLSTILGDDTGSRLYWSIYQAGLADSATAQVMDFEDIGLILVHLGTDPERAQTALDTTQQELKRLQESGVEEAELDRAKAKLNSSVVIGGESTNERVMALINSWLTQGRLETLEEIRQKIDAVSREDIEAYLRDFPVWPDQVTTAVGPLGADALRNPIV